jgi:hypothetical protein
LSLGAAIGVEEERKTETKKSKETNQQSRIVFEKSSRERAKQTFQLGRYCVSSLRFTILR